MHQVFSSPRYSFVFASACDQFQSPHAYHFLLVELCNMSASDPDFADTFDVEDADLFTNRDTSVAPSALSYGASDSDSEGEGT